jgi:hypothetical protein
MRSGMCEDCEYVRSGMYEDCGEWDVRGLSICEDSEYVMTVNM